VAEVAGGGALAQPARARVRVSARADRVAVARAAGRARVEPRGGVDVEEYDDMSTYAVFVRFGSRRRKIQEGGEQGEAGGACNADAVLLATSDPIGYGYVDNSHSSQSDFGNYIWVEYR
jgi:hypothetical protein